MLGPLGDVCWSLNHRHWSYKSTQLSREAHSIMTINKPGSKFSKASKPYRYLELHEMIQNRISECISSCITIINTTKQQEIHGRIGYLSHITTEIRVYTCFTSTYSILKNHQRWEVIIIILEQITFQHFKRSMNTISEFSSVINHTSG